MKPFYIYFILNKLTGKYYVGQTVRTPEDRWLAHKTDAKSGRFKKNYFHNALRYYGFENFELRTIFVCYDLETLNEAEVFFISLFQSARPDFGYNGSSGGKNSIPTKQTREKMSAAGLGKTQSMEHVRKRALAISGKKRPPEVVQKFNKKGRKRKPHSEGTKEKMRQRATGRHHTEETKEKLRKPHTEERRLNIIEGLRKRREREKQT